jgi:zinc transport system ATP-binding protein
LRSHGGASVCDRPEPGPRLEPGPEPAAVELHGVWVRRASLTVLEDVNARIPAGSFTGLIGPNGGGKTTLLRLLLGLLRPDAGRVRVLGQDPCCHRAVRQQIGYLPQVPRLELGFPVSVRDVVELGCLGHAGAGVGTAARREAASWAIDLVGIGDLAARPVGELSGGQRQMALLARALACRPRLLLLDEPLTGLDRERRAAFYPLVRRLQRAQSMTVVAVCHDLQALTTDVDELLCLDRTVHAHAAPALIPSLGDWTAGHQRCMVDALLHGTVNGDNSGCAGCPGC